MFIYYLPPPHTPTVMQAHKSVFLVSFFFHSKLSAGSAPRTVQGTQVGSNRDLIKLDKCMPWMKEILQTAEGQVAQACG